MTAWVRNWLGYVAWSMGCLLLLPIGVPVVRAANVAQTYPIVRSYFPKANRFGDFSGKPPAAPVYQGSTLLGYVLVSTEVVHINGYGGDPIETLVAFNVAGKITGVKVLAQNEPILKVGIPPSALDPDFVKQYLGQQITDKFILGVGKRKGYINIDAISSATVTAQATNETILRAARKVAVARGLIKRSVESRQPPAKVKRNLFKSADWQFLVGEGAIRRLRLTYGEIERAFKGTAAAAVTQVPKNQSQNTFIDLYYAYLNPPTIGRNLLGNSQYRWLMSQLKPGEQAVAFLANGSYSFKGSGYVRGGIFDRIHLMQGGQVISFRDLDYTRLMDVYAKGMPSFNEMGIFVVRKKFALDPGRPWSVELLVKEETGPVSSVFTSFTGAYRVPERYITRPAPVAVPEPLPLWAKIWQGRAVQIGVLITGLAVLFLVLLFQDWIAKRPRLLSWVRDGYLLFTLFYLGWYAMGQLSVVNVFAFTTSVEKHFDWNTFLMDPILFILWTFVAVALLLWGRGVYCGWLCPFGALQELVNKVSRHFKVKQWEFPNVVHERLWALKYVILIVLFGISLQSLGMAERFAEVEPFKTAIILHFNREWPFVLYAVALVAISVVNRKFYCKYLCPLGAAIAIPARLRLFNWLRRRKECGKPCQVCANECEVRAIHPTGEINANECHYCLDCQVTYWNDHKCPPLVQHRRRRWRGESARGAKPGMGASLGEGARTAATSTE